MQALNEFQSNPQQALEKYGDNPEVQRFLKEFCALLGKVLCVYVCVLCS